MVCRYPSDSDVTLFDMYSEMMILYRYVPRSWSHCGGCYEADTTLVIFKHRGVCGGLLDTVAKCGAQFRQNCSHGY